MVELFAFAIFLPLPPQQMGGGKNAKNTILLVTYFKMKEKPKQTSEACLMWVYILYILFSCLLLSDLWCFPGFCHRKLYWTCENKDFNPPECMLYVDH